jgi:spore coat protein H
VTDDHGNAATDSVVINVRHPASSSVDYWTVFDDSEVRRVDVSLTTADWQTMWTDPEAKIKVPADAVVFGQRLDNAGFRMRGQWSLRGSGEKKPWKINTDAYIGDQEFFNLRQLVFVNSLEDPSLIQEKMAYDLMHFAGVPASHVCYVEIWIDLTDDGEPPIFWGVYTMIERVDKKFVANRFGRDNKGGNLYKASLAQRGPMDLVYHGDRIENYPSQGGLYNIGKANNEEKADYDDIINFMRVIDGVTYETPQDFARALEEVFNVDAFLRYMAAAITLSGWDIYPFAGNNYYLYHNPGTGKFEWIPWDLTWGGDPTQPLFGRQGLGFLERAPLYDRVFEVERYRVKYAAYLDLFNREWFTTDNVSARVKKLHDLIAPYVTQGSGDKMYFGDTAVYPIEAFNTTWMEFGEFARQRSHFILTTLAQDQWRSSDLVNH